MARGRQTGRILPHQRDTDDRVPIIFADAVINEEHAAAVHTTESQGMKPKTRNEYRNRENHLMVFWEHKYPDYFEQGTVLLTDEEKNDPNKYYHKNQRDIRYAGINVKLITAFLSNKKTKANGNLVHPSDLQKYGDAIKWGATVAGQKLPTEYHIGMDKFLRAYRKEFEEVKWNDKVDEKASDPVNESGAPAPAPDASADVNNGRGELSGSNPFEYPSSASSVRVLSATASAEQKNFDANRLLDEGGGEESTFSLQLLIGTSESENSYSPSQITTKGKVTERSEQQEIQDDSSTEYRLIGSPS